MILKQHFEHFKFFLKKNCDKRDNIHFSILSYRFIEYTQRALYASVSVYSTGKDHFILPKANTTLNLLEPTCLLYYGSLKIKQVKFKDVSDLASKYVPAEYLWYYRNLKSNGDPQNIDYSDID